LQDLISQYGTFHSTDSSVGISIRLERGEQALKSIPDPGKIFSFQAPIQLSPEISAGLKRPGHETGPPSAQLILQPQINSPNALEAFQLI
jgi:hypothetical protein